MLGSERPHGIGPELGYRYPGEELAGRMAGGHLESPARAAIRVGGLAVLRGHHQLRLRSPRPPSHRPTGLLEATLGAASEPVHLLPLDRRGPAAVRRWLHAESTMRVILPSYAEGRDAAGYTMTVPSLRDAFGAVVFVRNTTASQLILPDRPT